MKEGILKFIKDVLFPCFCAGCGKEGSFLCYDCLHKLHADKERACPLCKSEDSSTGSVGLCEICDKCKAVSPLDGLTAFFSYKKNPTVKDIIKIFKYSFAKDAESAICALVQKGIKESGFHFKGNNLRDFHVVAVPLHPLRQRFRGFNQAEIIAVRIRDYFCKENNRSEQDFFCLRRIKNTNQQANLHKTERSQNMKGAFVCDRPVGQRSEFNVILVDDVYTSGATMQECARALKKAGAEIVCGVALARG
ncbi:MAG: ComF family protein [bacterium]